MVLMELTSRQPDRKGALRWQYYWEPPCNKNLDSVKSLGQSYDGVIQELINFCKEKNKEYWTRRQKQRRQ